eukprot:scaffold177067_cov38-Prasinocladus_malaysianus.AAC.1
MSATGTLAFFRSTLPPGERPSATERRVLDDRNLQPMAAPAIAVETATPATTTDRISTSLPHFNSNN